jgi:hypothetical protein
VFDPPDAPVKPDGAAGSQQAATCVAADETERLSAARLAGAIAIIGKKGGWTF